MLRAFFDESGTDPKSNAYVMGGFLASVEEWERASDAWDECLAEPPKIAYFSHRKTDDAKSLRLAEVIARFDLQGFCATIPHEYFSERDPRASRKIMGTRIYDWAFLSATHGVLNYMQMVHPEEKVDFVFDHRTELNTCILAYNELKSMSSPPATMKWAGECIPGDDKLLMPLQMADFLAGEFASMVNGEKASAAWKIIAGKNPVAHIKGYLPPSSRRSMDLQKMSKEIEDKANRVLKRFYKDGERSIEMVGEVAELVKMKDFFNDRFAEHEAQYLEDSGYKQFVLEQQERRRLKGLK